MRSPQVNDAVIVGETAGRREECGWERVALQYDKVVKVSGLTRMRQHQTRLNRWYRDWKGFNTGGRSPSGPLSRRNSITPVRSVASVAQLPLHPHASS